MSMYEKAKHIANKIFDNVEIYLINFSIRRLYRWKLKHRYMLKTDTMSSKYKKEILNYWHKYTKKIKPNWHKYYSSRNGIYDVRYVPDDLYYTVIDQHFNSRKYAWGVNDKNYYSLWFPETRQPKVVIRKINGFYYNESYSLLSYHDAINLCLENNSIIIKPAVETGGGKKISFWNKQKSIEELKRLLLLEGKNLIVQEIIAQHENLKKIHSSSINTVRIISLLFKEQVHILSSVLRMGVDGSNVDNASVGGITCGIKENGQLKSIAFSAHGVKYDKHPQGFEFSDCIIPSFNEVKSVVKNEHSKMAHFRLISWDIAIGEDGKPILIEANLRNGELDFHQFNNGPLFGELTDEVLTEVFYK